MGTQQDKLAWQQWQASQKGKSTMMNSLAGGGGGSSSSSSSSISTGSANPLPANNNAQLAELQGLIGKLPGYFDTSGLEKGYDQQQQFNTSIGMQASGNAAREFINRQALQGGDRSLGGLVRAQSMLPFLQQNADLTQRKEAAKMDANSALAQLTGNVATSLGQLRTNYLGTLANYTSNQNQIRSNESMDRARLAQQASQFGQSFGLEQRRFGASENQREFQKNVTRDQLDLQKLLSMQQFNKGQSRQNDPWTLGSQTFY